MILVGVVTVIDTFNKLEMSQIDEETTDDDDPLNTRVMGLVGMAFGDQLEALLHNPDDAGPIQVNTFP